MEQWISTTKLKCAGCGNVWEGYFVFVCPENTREYSWTCEECSYPNAYPVKKWLKEREQRQGRADGRGDGDLRSKYNP